MNSGKRQMTHLYYNKKGKIAGAMSHNIDNIITFYIIKRYYH
jgi:hypothetical protein